ncbi:hypothetical protein Z946_3266 [Sulfitobacter noctilucicola]|nr:hypothetical protein Z946_3266 [Sulfitobacter noctilucicola]
MHGVLLQNVDIDTLRYAGSAAMIQIKLMQEGAKWLNML